MTQRTGNYPIFQSRVFDWTFFSFFFQQARGWRAWQTWEMSSIELVMAIHSVVRARLYIHMRARARLIRLLTGHGSTDNWYIILEARPWEGDDDDDDDAMMTRPWMDGVRSKVIFGFVGPRSVSGGRKCELYFPIGNGDWGKKIRNWKFELD